jgi:hypothetical protein
MNELFKDCVNEVFTNKNLITLWDKRNSKEDIIGLDTELPIRFKLNDKGTRNVELMLQSQFGFYYKTIALIENEDILFPRAFDKLIGRFDLKNFKRFGLKPEINVMIGAFSMESLAYAIKNEDVDSYKSNDTNFELVKAFDGTMQTFVKEENNSLMSFSFESNLYKSQLDDVAVSAFKFNNGNSGVYPTNDTHTWLERLSPQRLLEIFTIEKE